MSSTAVQKDNVLWEAKNDTASDSHYFYKNSGSPARTRDRAVLIKVDLVVVPIVGMFCAFLMRKQTISYPALTLAFLFIDFRSFVFPG